MQNIFNLSRRRFVGSGLALATASRLEPTARALGLSTADGVCSLNAEQEVGPYYLADELLRSNIAEGRSGIPLTLRLVVLNTRSCKPLAGAAIDVWHCDALGLYSGYTAVNPGGPAGPPPEFDGRPGPLPRVGNQDGPPDGFGPPPANHPTDKLTFLRGIQITDADGSVTFNTIFPGYYMGRTNHIHFKVRVDGKTGTGSGHPTYLAGHTSHTGQVFFPEQLASSLMLRDPYRRHAIHRTTQDEDGVYNDQHGELSIANVSFVQSGKPEAGLRATLIAAVDPAATPSPAHPFGAGGL